MAEPTEIQDTSAVSNFLKFGDRSSAYPWFQEPHVPAISFQTAAELLVWALSESIVPYGPVQVRDFLADAIVLDGLPDAVNPYAAVVRRRIDEGRDKNVEDAWTGAAAVAAGLPIVTYDKAGFLEFVPLGLDLRLLHDS